jgi:primosomal protein N' (replication factor Y)
MRYVEVLPLIPLSPGKQAGVYTYEIPPNLLTKVQTGQILEVPIRNRQVKGLALRLLDKKPRFPLKPVSRILISEPLIDSRQIQLAYLVADYYLASVGSVIGLMVPPIRKFVVKKIFALNPLASLPNLNATQSKIVETLKKFDELHEDDLERLELSRSSIATLVKNGVVSQSFTVKYRTQDFQNSGVLETPHNLTPTQTEVLAQISTATKPVLLFGVTASGKTEIYLRLVEEALKKGQSSIILVPEIALTPQTIKRFADRFGEDSLAVIHSKIKGGVKFDTWQQIMTGSKKVIIGARSALFAPVRNLGVIVIDEEHDSSYKQDSTPRYHATFVAEHMARLHKAKLVLGSATPRLESYYKSQIGDYLRVEMKAPVFQAKKKKLIQVVDMTAEVRSGNKTFFSELLTLGLKYSLANKEQSLLFLNRRGSRTMAFCLDCGHTVNCPQCDIPLIYHRKSDTGEHKMKCHHCGFEQQALLACPACLSPRLKYYGLGTEQVETELRTLFPQARIVRFDKDTVKTADDYHRLYHQIANHEADIIVGTQMIAKGWDLPKLNLVGLVMADTGFNFPDFHTYERMFSLIVQVIGRSGRRQDPARVIIQTHNPDNPVLLAAIEEDYEGFAKDELARRKDLDWPPFVQVVRLMKSSANATKLRENADKLCEKIKKMIPDAEVNCSPAFFSRLRGEYRYQILIRGEEINKKLVPKELEDWTIDVDPMSML